MQRVHSLLLLQSNLISPQRPFLPSHTPPPLSLFGIYPFSPSVLCAEPFSLLFKPSAYLTTHTLPATPPPNDCQPCVLVQRLVDAVVPRQNLTSSSDHLTHLYSLDTYFRPPDRYQAVCRVLIHGFMNHRDRRTSHTIPGLSASPFSTRAEQRRRPRWHHGRPSMVATRGFPPPHSYHVPCPPPDFPQENRAVTRRYLCRHSRPQNQVC